MHEVHIIFFGSLSNARDKLCPPFPAHLRCEYTNRFTLRMWLCRRQHTLRPIKSNDGIISLILARRKTGITNCVELYGDEVVLKAAIQQFNEIGQQVVGRGLTLKSM